MAIKKEFNTINKRARTAQDTNLEIGKNDRNNGKGL